MENSKTAKQLLSELRRRDIRLWLEGDRLCFDAPDGELTLGLLEQLRQHKAEIINRLQQIPQASKTASTAIQYLDRQSPFPLSSNQRQLWFLKQLLKSGVYNVPDAVHLCGEIFIPRLEQAFQQLIKRHEALRTRFHDDLTGHPQLTIEPEADFRLKCVDLQSLPSPQAETQAMQMVEADASVPFDLSKCPLLRATLFHIGPSTYILYWVLHHIIADGWSSIRVFLRDLSYFYRHDVVSNLKQENHALPVLPIQFVDYHAWHRGNLDDAYKNRQIAYWCKQLQSAPPINPLPTDFQRPAQQSFRGDRVYLDICTTVTSELKKLAQRTGVNVYTSIKTTINVLLHRYSGQIDLVVGSVIAGRKHPDVQEVMGYFTNTVALRNDLSGCPTFIDLLGSVHNVVLDALQNDDVSFEEVVTALNPVRDLGQNPIFQLCMAFYNGGQKHLDLPNVTVQSVAFNPGTSKFDLMAFLIDAGDRITGYFEFSPDLFERSTIENLLQHFCDLTEQIVTHPERHIHEYTMLTPSEKQQLLFEWNQPEIVYPEMPCVHHWFEQQVAQTPNAIALVYEQQLTYQALNERANQLAHYLRSLGVQPEMRVGLCLNRSIEMIVGMLGILKAGGAYVPLDPDAPAERRALILRDACVSILVSQSSTIQQSGTLPSCQVVDILHQWDTISQFERHNPSPLATRDNLAYVIYTSGSTGMPKGVAITHANVGRLFQSTRAWYQFDYRDVWVLFHSYAFDVSVWEIFGALLHGGRLVIAPFEVGRSPDAFYKLLTSERITVLCQTPSAFRQFMQFEENMTQPHALALRLIIFAGEALAYPSLKPWVQRHGDQHPRLVNMYGPTETTVYATYRPITANDLEAPGSFIGRPLLDLQLYVLDEHRQLAAIGARGELYIGGAGIARGYLNRDSLTAERFVENPFRPGTRLYKTGDFVRYRRNGELEYLGRIDQQVKLRGFRIELGEIETRLCQIDGVQEAVVTVREDTPGDQRLVAYIVPSQMMMLHAHLRDCLKQTLPDYMIPSTWVMLEKLPLTVNGKMDRRALPKPNSASMEFLNTWVAPRNATELTLSEIWSSLLKVESVGIRDNFFELGGHSLLAVRLMADIQRQFGRALPLGSLFQNATIEQLADLLMCQHRPEATSPLISLQPKGTQTPLFCIPGSSGQVFYLLALAQALGSDRPFYALQRPGSDGCTSPLKTVKSMADYYLSAIRSVWPHGPYYVVGHSLGAWIAFEIALKLQREGIDQVHVILLDMLAPAPKAKGNIEVKPEKLLNSLLKIMEAISGQTIQLNKQQLLRLSLNEQLEMLKTELIRLDVMSAHTNVDEVLGILHVLEADEIAQACYWPCEMLLQDCVLLRTSKVFTMDTPEIFAATQYPDWGWQELSARPVSVYEVPGDHATMLKPPHVQVLAEYIKRALVRFEDKAQIAHSVTLAT